MLNATLTAFSITWDPGLRGIAVVVVGVAVLMGSVYLVLGTNLGSRVGFLVAIAGLSGWMALMGFVWAMYGIGYKGTGPSWKVREVVTSERADDLRASALEDAHELGKWKSLPADDPSRGEATATATAALTGDDSPVKQFESDAEFDVIEALDFGGKKSNFFDDWVPGPHPPHYMIIQVQAVEPVEVEFGETPPEPEIDESAPVQSVVLVRDLGKLRVPSVLVMLASLIVFGITCNVLHRRDKAAWAARAEAGV